MKHWTNAQLTSESVGRHLASEAHLRAQIVSIPASDERTSDALFSGYHGELLILCAKGSVRVRTGESTTVLEERDQALLIDGEPFRVDRADGHDAVVQLIWTPGPTPCRACWESDGRFFSG